MLRSLGPDSVSSTPSDEVVLNFAVIENIYPIQESSAQLSGPDIPGAQINEDGKWVLRVKSAVSINHIFRKLGHPLTQLWKAGSLFLARMSHGAMNSKLLVKLYSRGEFARV